MSDDGRYVKTPYGKVPTEVWLRQQLERERRREAAVARFGRQVDDGRGPQPAPPPTVRREGPGRPGWTPELFHERYQEAHDRTPPPRTAGRIADVFRLLNDEVGTSTQYLASLLRKHGKRR